MPEHDMPAHDMFEAQRPRLRAIALRMLGSEADADDVVQETWVRLHGTDTDTIANPGGWLTTVTARICLDVLRSRTHRPTAPAESIVERADPHAVDPVTDAELSDAIGSAVLVVLDTLAPSERLAFVLHDLFAVPFDEIARVLRRSPSAAKQLASRARHKVRGGEPTGDHDPVVQRSVVDAFLAAARGGDLQRLITLLHPGVVLDADEMAVRMGSPERTAGAHDVAATFSGRALGAEAALIDGVVGFVWRMNDQLKVAWDVTIIDGAIAHIDMLAIPEVLADLTLVVV
jgi:RNA polymerase sigma-70 factor (ECF subfamily)